MTRSLILRTYVTRPVLAGIDEPIGARGAPHLRHPVLAREELDSGRSGDPGGIDEASLIMCSRLSQTENA
jgi:hypothetical protein